MVTCVTYYSAMIVCLKRRDSENTKPGDCPPSLLGVAAQISQNTQKTWVQCFVSDGFGCLPSPLACPVVPAPQVHPVVPEIGDQENI